MILNNGKEVYYEKIKPQICFSLKNFSSIQGHTITYKVTDLPYHVF